MQSKALIEFSAMFREKRREKNLNMAVLAAQAKVSTKTLTLIEDGRWKSDSGHWRRSFPNVLARLGPVLGFNVAEWAEQLNLDFTSLPVPTTLSVEDLEYLLGIAKGLKEPLPLQVAMELLKLRK